MAEAMDKWEEGWAKSEDTELEEGEIPNVFFELGKEIGSNSEMLSEFMNGLLDSTFQIEFALNHEYFPTRATEGSVGFDLYAPRSVRIAPRDQVKIRMGINIFFNNPNQYAQLHSRSGLACLYGIEVVGSGVIDSDYTEEIACFLRNNSDSEYKVYAGDRICQLIFYPFHRVRLVCLENNKTQPVEKRRGGFGSSGR